MFKHIDWLMICGYFKSYFICLVSLLTLYIVVDLFTNLDDFVQVNTRGVQSVFVRIISYYGFRVPQFFDRLCEAIVLLAAVFTVAMMQRNNEQIPLLSSGVSTQRIVAPVLCCACFMMTLTVLNQELLIPRIGYKLTLDRNDPGGEKEVMVRSGYEPNMIHIEGDRAIRATRTVRNFRCTIPENVAGNLIHIVADEGRYVPNEDDSGRGGKWILTGCQPRDLEPIDGVVEVVDAGRYLLTTRSVDFESLVRDPKWFNLASTRRLFQELQRPESNRLAAIAVLFHSRLTRPLLGMVLVLMGLGVILRDQNRNVIISAGLCLVLCAVFFASCYACKMMGDYEYLTPALAAWLPVITFGPFAIVMFDAVHT
ncbi:MAG: LptF/LptG family permease [Gemmataceae bacterium]